MPSQLFSETATLNPFIKAKNFAHIEILWLKWLALNDNRSDWQIHVDSENRFVSCFLDRKHRVPVSYFKEETAINWQRSPGGCFACWNKSYFDWQRPGWVSQWLTELWWVTVMIGRWVLTWNVLTRRCSQLKQCKGSEITQSKLRSSQFHLQLNFNVFLFKFSVWHTLCGIIIKCKIDFFESIRPATNQQN